MRPIVAALPGGVNSFTERIVQMTKTVILMVIYIGDRGSSAQRCAGKKVTNCRTPVSPRDARCAG